MVFSFLGIGKKPSNSICRMVKIKVVLKEMVPKLELPESIPRHVQGLNYRDDLYELEDYVWEEALNSNLLLRFRPIRKIICACFPNHLLESI